MKTIKHFLFCLLLGSLFFPGFKVHAGIPEIILTGVVGGKLIKDFEEAGTRLMTQGENTGNALLASMGNQIRVATQNASLIMTDQQNTLFENLHKSQRDFFTELNAVIKQSSGDINRAIKVLEVANLNLIELTNRLPLTDKVLTYINKVEGLMQPHQNIPYQLRISGLGMGQDSPDRKYTTTISISGNVVPSAMISKQPPYDMTILISTAFLEKFFDNNSIKFVPVAIRTVVEYRETCALFFSCDETLTSVWNLKLVLLPRFPGIITGEELIKGETLDNETKTTSVSVTTVGCKSDSPCDWTREIPIPDNARVVGVRYSCAGQCGWSYGLRRGG